MQCLKRCGLFLAGLAIALSLSLGSVLWFAADWLVDVSPPEKSDAIILLAGQPTRALQAGDLYRQGIAPKVYVSMEMPRWDLAQLRAVGVDLPESDVVMTRVLRGKGVPGEAIMLFGKANISTRAEADRLAETLPPEVRKITVVTSPYHKRRARIILSRALPGREVRMAANSYEPWARDWWNNKSVAYLIVTELASTVFYYAGGKF